MAGPIKCPHEFTDVQQTAARTLEPVSENLLRSSEVNEDVIMALSINEVTDRKVFTGLDSNEEGFKKHDPEFGININEGGLPHNRETARRVKTWNRGKVMQETKLEADAVAKAHGETLLCSQRTGLAVQEVWCQAM